MNNVSNNSVSSWSTLWVWVVFAFVLLIGAWTALITVASKNAPDAVPLISSQ